MNADWVEFVINSMGKIGRNFEGGVSRLGFTRADSEGREYFISLIKEAGFEPLTDDFGNISAKYGGISSNPTVATGSHIDTVPNGGLYDGVLGVASSLAAMMRLKADGVSLQNPLELIVFALEESSRFGFATMGSKVLSGKYKPEVFAEAYDKDGNTLQSAMQSCGFNLSNACSAVRSKGEFKAFIELHMDQSGDLEKAGHPIGIVEALAAPIRAKISITGEAAHSGSAKMRERKDALVSAAEFILSVRNFAMAYVDKRITATVGTINVYPGAINVVPGFAELHVDLRGVDRTVMDEVFGLIRSESSKIALRRGTPIEIELISEDNPVRMDTHIYSVIKSSCASLGFGCENIISGAGHDAMNMASIAPSGMIFVRGKGAIGHRPDEFVAKDDIEKGLLVLTESLKRLAI